VPKMPWTRGLFREDAELFVLTSKLPLNRYRDVPRFLRWSLKIRRQLLSDPGCAGFTLDAQLAQKTFWTLSAWQDRAAMMASSEAASTRPCCTTWPAGSGTPASSNQ
jgi:quinol monooxygenase YgiN